MIILDFKIASYFIGQAQIILTDFSDEAVARKFNMISPISDTGDVCKALVKEYDQKINEAIEAGRPISIEEMIESPSLIALQCFEGRDTISTPDAPPLSRKNI